MNGIAVYQMETTSVPECIQEILRINGLGLEDVSMIVPHQATAGVLKRIAEVLNIPFSRIQTNLEFYANTAGATVPLLLDQVNRRGLLREGDLLLLVSIGAGWTWGASLYRW
jgi:3-oxoacyl-[acyl-carrier-protein] synthase-3